MGNKGLGGAWKGHEKIGEGSFEEGERGTIRRRHGHVGGCRWPQGMIWGGHGGVLDVKNGRNPNYL